MAVKVRIQDNKKTWNKFVRSVKTLNTNRVDVGVFGKQGSDLVITAASNEFGVPFEKPKRIPARSHLRTAIGDNKPAFVKLVQKNFVKVTTGFKPAKRFLNQLGFLGVRLVKDKIKKGPFKENAESTLRQKFPKTKPLINTGRLRRSYIHRVVRRGMGATIS
jgi:hypothetical protein